LTFKFDKNSTNL